MASSYGLKQDLGGQGVGLLSTALLGTGVFAVPAIVAQLSGNGSLWAWPLLIALGFPIAIGFAALGQHFPMPVGRLTLSIWRLARVWPASGPCHPLAISFRDPPWVACCAANCR